MRVTPAVKINKQLHKIKEMVETLIYISDTLASVSAPTKPTKKLKKKKA